MTIEGTEINQKPSVKAHTVGKAYKAWFRVESASFDELEKTHQNVSFIFAACLLETLAFFP